MRRHTLSSRFRLCAAWIACSLSGPIWAQAATPEPMPEAAVGSAHSVPLTLDVAWQRALLQHPDLRAAMAERDAATALTRQAGAWPNPELSALQEDTRADRRTTTWQWSQPIEGLGKRAARVNAAQWAQRAAEGEVQARQVQLRARLSLAFHAAQLAQARVALAAELVQLAAQSRETARRRVAAGKAAPIEEVKAQVAEAQAVSAQRAAHSAWRAAWQALRQAMGGGQAEPLRVDADLQALPDDAPWRAVLDRPDEATAVQRAALALSRQQAWVEVERTRARPDVTVQLGIKRDVQVGRNQPLVGISLPLPAWDRNEGAITAALRQADRAEADLDSTRASVQAQASEALEQLRTAIEQHRTLNATVLPAASQALDIAGKGYALGKFGILDVLDAQRTLFDVRHQVLNSAEQAFRAQARLIELFGDAPASRD